MVVGCDLLLEAGTQPGLDLVAELVSQLAVVAILIL